VSERPLLRAANPSLTAGVVTGFLAVLLVLVRGALAPNVEFVSNGADLTGHSAARVIVSDEHAVLAEATCRDACDDLRLEARVEENSVFVRVIDAAGRNICCGTGIYTDASSKTLLTVNGRERLELTTRYKTNY
jgi:hypothetical protein